MYITKVDELNIYQISLEIDKEVNILIKQIPYYWNIPESKQIIRSSGSISANIAEGFTHRFYPKQFIRYLSIAMGSSDESQNHMIKLRNNNNVRPDVANEYIKRYKYLSIKVLNFITYLRKHQLTHN